MNLILISAKQTDCRIECIKQNDIAVVTSSKHGRFLAYVTKSRRIAGNTLHNELFDRHSRMLN